MSSPGKQDSPSGSNKLLTFEATMSNIFNEISKCVSENEFKSAFKDMKISSSNLKKLHKLMETDLFNKMNEDLQELVSDESLVEGMSQLEKLIEETPFPKDEKLWRPPGNVIQHLKTLDAKKIIDESEILKKYIDEKNIENERMMEDLNMKRKKVNVIGKKMKELLSLDLSELKGKIEFNRECVEQLIGKKSSN
ncbi:uncharacterized protein LOC106655142 [Trichogramma pretiosum]|uniref:uncharacterized protein LOC106655142 n=1 Tax=Trichogramma pretiosum TaxID=7493 RepID=UPI0006C9B867|nr:uncharacterized protein LOC106655142 [Trichogramma pretiosum]